MVEASGAHVLFIPQEHLASVCLQYGIEVLWEDSQAAAYGVAALERYNALTPEERKVLGQRILQPVVAQLREVVTTAIAEVPENPVIGVWVDIFFKRGEIGHHQFDSIEAALDYLRSWSQ
ncbi:MAG: hypothetical protein ACP5UM_15040 [Anaerolineae bacterium]